MPGQASLGATQYYAHPRNAFWPIMQALITRQPPTYTTHQTVDYDARCALLVEHGYALWDVLESCDRPGSLDSNIARASEIPNAIPRLVEQLPALRCIACNGRTAEKLFNRHIRASLPNDTLLASDDHSARQSARIRVVSLPSTSPAMASLNLAAKYQRWADGLLG